MNRKFLLFTKYVFFLLIIVAVAFTIYNKTGSDTGQVHIDNRELADNTITSSKTLKDSIVEYGMELLGTPYVTAGCSKDGFDCSGFVYFVFQNFNIDVPRSSAGFENFGKEIPIEDVQKGDLLLFLSPTRNAIGHIGIVSDPNGRNSDFIHSSSGREMKVIITNLSNSGYTRRFVKAVRVI